MGNIAFKTCLQIHYYRKSAFTLLGRWFWGITGIFIFSASVAQQAEPAIPHDQEALYRFNLHRLFYASEKTFTDTLVRFDQKLKAFSRHLEGAQQSDWLSKQTQALSRLEFEFRQMDLYLFLQYAINTNNTKAAEREDSLYEEMVKYRNRFKDKVRSMPEATFKKQILHPALQPYQYYLHNIRRLGSHEPSAEQQQMAKSFAYLKDGRFYTEHLNKAPFDNIIIGADTLDLFQDMGKWQHHPDSSIRKEGERKMAAGYSNMKQPVGYGYIQLINGLNAFASFRKYDNLVSETCGKLNITKQLLDTIFSTIEASAKSLHVVPQHPAVSTLTFPIQKTTRILLETFSVLGSTYSAEAKALLEPSNGRMDIVGGEARLGMQGVASVYPIHTSVFYARKYEGYFIDVMVLAHEAGHAIQASMMARHGVSMLNSSGPGYFTESFGKFNELLVTHYLNKHAGNTVEKQFYAEAYKERLLGLFGSALEAGIEYRLVEGITNKTISTPEDLDRVTLESLEKYEDVANPDIEKELWLRLETNYKAPLHNVNDMLASILALHYFSFYLRDPDTFRMKYIQFLQNGYDNTPSALLKQFMQINMEDPGFTAKAIDVIRREMAQLDKH